MSAKSAQIILGAQLDKVMLMEVDESVGAESGLGGVDDVEEAVRVLLRCVQLRQAG